jgi:arylsulfatase
VAAVAAVAWAAALLLAWTGCAPEEDPLPESVRRLPPIVLITIDALNVEHLSLYGYERESSPHLEGLAAESIFFRNAWAPSSWTAPSMASLFTGVYPRTHGVENGVLSLETAEIFGQERVPEHLLTLAERLRRAGYETIGISTNPHLTRAVGFADGFDHFFESAALRNAIADGMQVTGRLVRELLVDADEAVGIAMRYLRVRDRRRPYFLWLHLLDPHWPYSPRAPYIGEFGGGVRLDVDRDRLDLGVPMDKVEEFGLTAESGLFRHLVDCYDSEIRAVDEEIGRLVRQLPELEEGILVVTADHGEGLLEHGQLGHRLTLYEEEVRVPLLIRLPRSRRQQRVVESPVSLVDLTPTLLGLLGFPPDRSLPGEDLRPLWAGRFRIREIAAQLTTEFGRVIALRQGRWKLIRYLDYPKDDQLFDLVADPEERENRALSATADFQRLDAALEGWLARIPAAPPRVHGARLSESQVEELRALGYVSGAAPAPAATRGPEGLLAPPRLLEGKR